LVIAGIEIWHPGFRDSTNHIQGITPFITGAAALGILALFLIARQLRNPRIQARLTALIMIIMIPLLAGISIFMISLATTRMEEGANTELQGTSRALASTVSTWLELHASALQGLTLQPDIVNMDAEQQRPVLQAMAKSYPYMYLVSTTDLDGLNIARNDTAELTDYSDRNWFRAASVGSPVTYQSLIGRTTGQPALVVSMPIKDASGTIVGVGMFAADLTDLAEETQVSRLGERGFTYIVDANNQALAHPDATYTAELRDMSDYPPIVALRSGQVGRINFTDENGERWHAHAIRLDNGWAVIAQRPESEILAPVRQFQFIIILLVTAGGGIMLVLAWFTIRRTLQPIATLTNTISAISAGDLNRVVEVNSDDEIGLLAHTFNVMTSQIRNLVGGLEQRVQDRTHDLELASEVGRTITENMANASEMLVTAAELIRTRFDLYYTQVYLTDTASQKLILRAGTGDVGEQLLSRGHQLLIDSSSLNGQAVLEKKPVIVADTSQSASFKPNPLLPKTRSEMAVPLIANGHVIGVLDMQSEQPGALTEINLPAFEALAGQLAIAIQNAKLFAEVQEARSQVEAQMRRMTEHGWQDFMNAIEHGQKLGFMFDQSQVVRLKAETLSEALEDHDVRIPITITGTKVGEIHLPIEKGRDWTDHEFELIKATSAQLAQHIDNLRLLAQADQYRSEAQQAVRRLTREGWDNYLQTDSETEPGYLFDLTEVKPLDDKQNEASSHSIKHPMMVRDEVIGEIAVQMPAQGDEAAELLEAVGKQLSDHLENLRLSELNEKRAHREHALRQITSALRGSTNPATIMRTAVRELGSILGRKTVVQLATPEQANASGGEE
jgi:GAF domain-containing protein